MGARVSKAILVRAVFPSRSRLCLLFGVLISVLMSIPFASESRAVAVPGETDPSYKVKAALLFQFGRYVQWPDNFHPGGTGVFLVGIVGADPFGDFIDSMFYGRNIGGQKVQVQRFSSIEEVKPTHILFISRSVAGREAEVLKKLSGLPVLLVSDEISFAGTPGVNVNFVRSENKVRFVIYKKAVVNGLQISPSLIKLADAVFD